ALPPHHEALGRQVADGLASRPLADPELGGDLELVGDELSRLPLARADALDQALAHLGVKRTIAVSVGAAHAGVVCRIRMAGFLAISYIRSDRPWCLTKHGRQPGNKGKNAWPHRTF